MSIDSRVETLIPFAQAGEAFPGKDRVSPATLHRWRLHGVRGVKLETLLVGGLRYTSTEAIYRFIQAQNDEPSQVTMTPVQRRRQSEAARAELTKMGIFGSLGDTVALPAKHSVVTTEAARQ